MVFVIERGNGVGVVRRNTLPKSVMQYSRTREMLYGASAKLKSWMIDGCPASASRASISLTTWIGRWLSSL